MHILFRLLVLLFLIFLLILIIRRRLQLLARLELTIRAVYRGLRRLIALLSLLSLLFLFLFLDLSLIFFFVLLPLLVRVLFFVNLWVETANVEKVTSAVLKKLFLVVILSIVLEPDLILFKKVAIRREHKQVWF